MKIAVLAFLSICFTAFGEPVDVSGRWECKPVKENGRKLQLIELTLRKDGNCSMCIDFPDDPSYSTAIALYVVRYSFENNIVTIYGKREATCFYRLIVANDNQYLISIDENGQIPSKADIFIKMNAVLPKD